MSNLVLITLAAGGKEKRVDSSAATVDFTAVRIGASLLPITESTGKFDFGAKVLGNISPATVSGQAVEFAQLGTALAAYVPLTQVGAANGVAALDSGGKVPVAQLPNSILEYVGVWDASTNTPTLADYASGAAAGTHVGDVYRVSVAGSQNLGSGSISFVVGDYAIVNNLGKFEKSHAGADAVTSVNGFAGTVVLSTTDIAEGTNLYFTNARFDTRFGTAFATKSTTDLAEGTNLYYTAARFDTAFSGKTTTNLAEGTNLYYTAARFDTAFSGKTTTNLAEGTNLYFTVARAKAAAVANVITSGVTDVAPSQDAVFNALALKADVAGSTLTVTNDNASAVTVRQVVYVKPNGNVDLAVATNIALFDAVIGLVQATSIAAAASGKVNFTPGQVSGFSGLTPGKKYYLSRTSPGSIDLYANISWVAGDEVVCVGKALSATVLEFVPEFEYEY
jgi:hypothetical protein